MPTDPFVRDLIAYAILATVACGGIAIAFRLVTRKRRERERQRRFLETRIRF